MAILGPPNCKSIMHNFNNDIVGSIANNETEKVIFPFQLVRRRYSAREQKK